MNSTSLTVQKDGKIIVAGNTFFSDKGIVFALARYYPDGTLDESFASGGILKTIFENNLEFVNSSVLVSLQQDGKILVAGTTGSSSNEVFTLIRYLPDGSLDTSFNPVPGMLNTEVYYIEDSAPVTLDEDLQIFDRELTTTNYDKSTLMLSRKGGANSDDMFSSTGLMSELSEGSDLSMSGVNIGRIKQNSNGHLLIEFNSLATQTRVNSALRSIAYFNTNDTPPESIEIEWVFNDGNTGIQGDGGALSVAGVQKILISPTNDAPVGSVIIKGKAIEGQFLIASHTMTDPDGIGQISYQWFADGQAIQNAKDSVYKLTQDDVGKSLTVLASYQDNWGALETKFSPPTSVVNQGAMGSNSAVMSFVSLETPIETIETIGISPDGQFMLLKTNGITQTVNIHSVLEFSNSIIFANELTNLVQNRPVFSSIVNGVAGYFLPDIFTGPTSLNLKYQFIDYTPNVVLLGSVDNDFIKLAHTTSTGKAVNAGDGNDVVDGGVGSSFITGGGGSNTFFLDGRAAGPAWSTITDFKLGADKVTIWGWRQGTSHIKTSYSDFDSSGAEGFQGLTLHFENLLPDAAGVGEINDNLNSVTLTGMTLADFGATNLNELNAQISNKTNSLIRFGSVSDEYGDHGYLILG